MPGFDKPLYYLGKFIRFCGKFIIFAFVLTVVYVVVMLVLSTYAGHTLMENFRDTTLVVFGGIAGNFCYRVWEEMILKRK